MTDVLILYESRSREIENCALLATELELRGYEVKIKNIYSPFKYFIKPKVLVVPHLYNEQQLISFAKNLWLSNNRIVDLQYEQILGTCLKEDDIHNPKGQAKLAHHIAWGEDQATRYRNVGITESNIHVTGSMAMDLMRKEFSQYFLSKKDIAKQCKIDASKEWILFVSSFSYANRTEEELRRYEQMNPNAREFSNLSDDTLVLLLKWLKDVAEKYSSKLFIYRPHPAEKINSKLYELESHCSNFYIIGNFSMRQWARVADKIYNWYSTSIADIFFAHKSCYILRPLRIPQYLEVSILEGAKCLADYDEFEKSIINNDFYFPIPSEKMEYYYGKTESPMAFKQIANICEGLIVGNYEGADYNYGNYSRFNIANDDSFKKIIFEYIKIISFPLFCLFKIEKPYFLSNKWKDKVRLYKMDVYGVKGIYHQIKESLRPIVRSIS